MVVRDYRESDIPRIARLYYNTIHAINSRDYTPEQVNIWAPEVWPDEHWAERLASKYAVYVAEFEDLTTGFAELDASGHIDCFYVHHDWQRRGVGSMMLQRIEEDAMEDLKLSRLDVEASLTARPFFEAMGFVPDPDESRTNKEYEGLLFPCCFMIKALSEADEGASSGF